MSQILDLPPEVHQEIFKHCSIDVLKEVACSNSILNNIVREILWKHITIPFQYLNENDSTYFQGVTFNNLVFTRELNLGTRKADDDDDHNYKLFLYSLIQDDNCKKIFPNYRCILLRCNPRILTSLYIRFGYLNKDSHNTYFSIICQHLPELKSLSLLNSQLTDEQFYEITKMKSLERLDLDGSDVSDEGCLYICSLVSLTELNLSRDACDNKIGDMGMSELLSLKDLSLLNVEHTGISDVSLAIIGKLMYLESLNIGATNVTDEGILCLQLLTKLRVLCIKDNDNITDVSLSYIGNIATLETLDVNETKITDDGIPHICSLKKLRELVVSYCQDITDVALSYVCNMVNLEVLGVSDTKVTDSGLLHLYSLPRLRMLYIDACEITDKAIDNIERYMPSLDVN